METIGVVLPTDSGANMKLPDPYLLNYYEQAEERVLWLDKEVDEDCIEIAKKIIYWNMRDDDMEISVDKRKPIRLMIVSPGGDVYTMLAIMDSVAMSKTPVYTCVVSLAASAAFAILLAGHKRFAFPHAHGMWHSGSAGISGSMEQVQSATKHLDGIEDQMTEFFLSRTKVPARVLKKYKDKDWYMTAKEMLENGVIDRIVGAVDEILQ